MATVPRGSASILDVLDMRLCAAVTRSYARSLLLVWLLVEPVGAFGADISFYFVSKGQEFSQTDAGPPIPMSNSYRLLAEAGLSSSNYLLTATERAPGDGLTDSLKPALGSIATHSDKYGTLAGLDANEPDGEYELVFNTIHDGILTNTLQLKPASGPDPYPANPPHISNFADLQAFNPAAPVTMHWDAFTGATEQDFIEVTIADAAGGVLFQSPFPGQAGVIPGTATALTIPANTVPPSTTLACQVLFLKVVSQNTSSYPGVTGVAGYYARTIVVFVTGMASTPLQLLALRPMKSGQFQLQLFGQPGVAYIIEGAAALPPSTWIALSTNVTVNGSFTFFDQQSLGLPARFYRARSSTGN